MIKERWRIPLAMAALSTAASFLVGGYEFVRSVSTSEFIDAYGSARLPYAMTAMVPVLALLVYVYGRVLSRWGAMRSLAGTSLLSAGVFVACYFGLQAGFKPAAVILYIYRQAYIVIIIEQYWSLINSTLTHSQAKLYNGPIIGGASVGPIIAGAVLHRWAVSLGSEPFILLAAATLIPAAIFSYAAYSLAGEPKPSAAEKGGGEGHINLKLFSRTRSLVYLAVVVGLTQVVSTALSLRFYGLLESSIAIKDARTAYLGGFWSIINSFSFVLQFILTPIIMHRATLRTIFIGIPLMHAVACAAVLVSPSLTVAATSVILFKGFDYSLFRAAKETLYIPLSFDARYRAKQVIDAFTYRFAKGGTAALMALASGAMGTVPGAAYAALAGAAALAWAGVAVPLTRKKKA